MNETVATSYAIRVVAPEDYRSRRDVLRAEGKSVWDDIKASQTVPLYFLLGRNDEPRFCTVCPGCGANLGGILADSPVSGWDEPRWKVENEEAAHLTMTPSLGCGGWRAGICPGHWWIRDGQLVLAG